MDVLFTIFIFSIILFLYLHIYYHLKTSEDLEIYTLKNPSKEYLEEICTIRQPVLFEFNNKDILDNFNLHNLETNLGIFDVNIRKKGDELYLPITLKEAIPLFQKDQEENYITEQNYDLLQETGLHKILRHNDVFLRPPMVSNCSYDICSGSIKSFTPVRYNLNYRNYIFVTEGRVKLRLISPFYSKYLHLIKDYENFEFRSPLNIWNIQEEFAKDFGKIKYLDVELKKGDIIYIPAFWWWSVQYLDLSCLLMFKYRTYMNTVAILPQIIIQMLQKLNVKWNIVHKLQSIHKEPDHKDNTEQGIVNNG